MEIWTTIGVILAGIVSLFTIVVSATRGCRKVKKVAKKSFQKEEFINNLPDTLSRLESKIDESSKKLDETNENVINLGAKVEMLDTQFLKYRISDAFYSFGDLSNIPYEILLNASQCGDLYMGKGLNHETSTQIKCINEEIERRQRAYIRGSEKDE